MEKEAHNFQSPASSGPSGAANSQAPSINLPKGGGAIRGIGEKFAANPVTGTGSMSIPISTSPGRSEFGPSLSLSYDSGGSNSPFGFGWNLPLPNVSRKTNKGLPQYQNTADSDVFVISGTEDLVPVYRRDRSGSWIATHPGHSRDPDTFLVQDQEDKHIVHEDEMDGFLVRRYQPRIEGLFARIERWSRIESPTDVHWRSISKDNVLTIYGLDTESRVYDSQDNTRIFSWLICETRDDKGNAILYRYKAEDGQGVNLEKAHQRNRGQPNDTRRATNRYLKRIHYGNQVSLLDDNNTRPHFLDSAEITAQLETTQWMFEVVFDYGDHDAATPKPKDNEEMDSNGTLVYPWTLRPDPFSDYRSGFEVRTSRLCQRVLMFHHFPEEPGVGKDCLVASTELTHTNKADPTNERNPIYSKLLSATQTGYRRHSSGYDRKSIPPVEFEYTEPKVEDVVRQVNTESLENLPIGLNHPSYRWVDLHGEGLTGILSEQAEAWHYKRNHSPVSNISSGHTGTIKATFAPKELVLKKPNVSLNTGAEVLDLAGDGLPDVVVVEDPVPGMFEHDDAESWELFRSFRSHPNYSFRDPNLRVVDLTGDGNADILITENDAFVWHASLQEAGFGPANRVAQKLNEETGPRVVFSDQTQAIYLSDLSGDGLSDLVRIRNGEVCYWPNLGYAKFGAKVTMDNAPRFDNPGQFDQQRIRLADIDGTGTADIIYLHREGVRLYFNQSGNSWSNPTILDVFPVVDDLVNIVPVDLLGNGTACLVWSSSLPGDSGTQMRYVDLMGGQKPHLLVKTVNNLGAESNVNYVPSTRFSLQDKLDGNPWVTRLPFPVHVVEKVTTVDHISQNRFVSRYAYHHGYFDGEEREFRGFGMVEQFDSEAYEDYVIGVASIDGGQETTKELYQPPVTSRTWYHTGAYFNEKKILDQYQQEYFLKDQHLPQPILPANLSADELREAHRALKGLILRQEIYSFDGTTSEQVPYSVAENTYEIRHIQPRGDNKYAVFFPLGTESISLNYEREITDPRVSHSFALTADEYGNPQETCSVVYGRQIVDPTLPAEVTRDQQKQYITYVEVDYTDDIEATTPANNYRLRTAFESRGFEISGITPASQHFKRNEIKTAISTATPIAYESIADNIAPQRRIISHDRNTFLSNDLNPLPLGQWESLGISHESYSLAFTPAVVATHYGSNVTDTDFSSAGYVRSNGDNNWWIPSGTPIFTADANKNFYLANGYRDPLGLETAVTRDQYNLLSEKVEVKQAAWNVVLATNDYRVLAPVLVTDPNKNRTAVEHDELGMITKTAIMGKTGSTDGDTLADPTTRMEYELFNWVNNQKPNFVRTFAREKHGAENPRWQQNYAYSNGNGSVAMVKTQALPGKALTVKPDGTLEEVDADPRWVGNGRAILNNKGNPVKQYEPYFSTTHEYESEKALTEIGVTPIIFYDPIGRNIRTDFPNGTLTRTEFTPWLQKIYDHNDTVKESRWYLERGSPDPATDSEPLNNPEQRAAWLAAKHADTPGIEHFDSLGRSIFGISDYGAGKTASVRSESYLTGRTSKIFDQLQREVANGFVGMAGNPITSESAEKGRQWTFQNVTGALIKTWDEHGRKFRTEYDELQRPVSAFVEETGQPEIMFSYVVYGDRHPNALQLNLLGTAHMVFDQAGMVRVPELDFKGNPKSVDRVLAKDYKNSLDWSSLPTQPDVTAIQAAANPFLEVSEVFTASSEHDALNRPTLVVFPDGTRISPVYNEANYLSSLSAQIRGQGAPIEFLKDQDYDAKGQRLFAQLGNDVFTQYFYDPNTFSLTNLLTFPSGSDPQTQSLQNLHYTYDPAGNITQIVDDAQQTHFFNNAVVKPQNLYEYDAVYQLVKASGRELAGGVNDNARTHTDIAAVSLPHANNTNAVRNYTEEYEYDLLGNIKTLNHRFQSQTGIGSGWTRQYKYTFEESPADRTNRLIATRAGSLPLADGPFPQTYEHDAYGNMTQMPHLTEMNWNSLDQLRHVNLNGGGNAHYVYGSGGQRMRKVIERNGDLNLEWIYLGPVTIFRRRKRSTQDLKFERWTVHIGDDTGQIAQVDVKTIDDDNIDPVNAISTAVVRYQYTNHLGSSTLETDSAGNPISYEEYHPYGTSSFRSSKVGFDISLKQYRFTGKERDDETGMYYFGARYYAPWLGRWTSSDPGGFIDGLNFYHYCSNNPIVLRDHTGLEGDSVQYPIGPEFDKDIHTNTPEAKEKIENRLKGYEFEENGVLYQIDKPILEWKGEEIGWFLHTEQSVRRADPALKKSGKRNSNQGKDSKEKKEQSSKPKSSPKPDSLTHAGPATEKSIWARTFRDRGFTLEHLYNNDIIKAIKALGDNRPLYDVEDTTSVKQIKSSSGNSKTLRAHASKATRDAGKAIEKNPTGTMHGKSPQAVVITPTDAAKSAGGDIQTGYDKIRRPVPNSSAPQHVRGLPGIVGKIGRALTVAGTGLSGFALASDIQNEDYSMAAGDSISLAGGALETYALASPGATVAGTSAMSAGLALGGIGIAATSLVGGIRAYQRGDKIGAGLGATGVLAGVAITAGVALGAPALLVGGLATAAVVGIAHVYRWLSG